MLRFRKTILYALLALALGFLLFLAPIFYQTFLFYHTGVVSFPKKPSIKTQTEVFLIGTRHTPTANFNSDTLYRHLEKIQPDIILLEVDSSFLHRDRLKPKYTFVMSFHPFLRKFWNLEMRAATKYVKYHEKVLIAAFDWGPADKLIKDVRSKSRSKMMNDLLNTDTDTVNRVFNECVKLHRYANYLPHLNAFNNSRTDALMEHYVHLEYEVIPSLVLQHDSLQQHHDFAGKFKSYWPTRNGHMAWNIVEAIKRNPNKRIVVLTGYKHRYLFHQLLRQASDTLEFALLDYLGKDLP